MRWFLDLPIRRKLTLVIMLTSGIGLLLAGTFIILYERGSYHRLMTEDLSTLAQVIGDQSTAALSFSDNKAAGETLAALEGKPDIVAAAIYTPDGQLFARYRRGDSKNDPLPAKPANFTYHFGANRLEMFQPIEQHGEKLGTVYLSASLERLQAHLTHDIGIVAAVILGLLVVTLLLSVAVQRAISDPIMNLAHAVHGVSESKDFSIRVPGEGKDEVGQLIDSFNRMLQRIEESDNMLRGVNTQLEGKSEEVKTMTQQLWQTAKLATMGELAASIAHELNNPLATVTLKIEALMLPLEEEDPRYKSLAVIEQEVDRMAGLVAHLLQFSRRSQQTNSSIDVRDEVKKTLELTQHYMNRRNIQVKLDFPDEIPTVHADQQQLRQLFLNLFSNASDAMTDGGLLTIRIRADEQKVVTDVIDTGTGIPADKLPLVMEAFYTTKQSGKGTGLGLGICRRIVQDHRGTFEIDSEVGKGTTVEVTLPVINTPTVPASMMEE